MQNEASRPPYTCRFKLLFFYLVVIVRQEWSTFNTVGEREAFNPVTRLLPASRGYTRYFCNFSQINLYPLTEVLRIRNPRSSKTP